MVSHGVVHIVSITLSLGPTDIAMNPSLVLVQPRKTRPYITERMLMGLNNQIKQTKQTELATAIFLLLFLSEKMNIFREILRVLGYA